MSERHRPIAPIPPPTGCYRTILADPPWMETGGGKCRRGADRHYPLMHTKDIAAIPVPAADDAHLWLCATNNHLPDALLVMAAWGFRYVTNRVWIKATPCNGRGAIEVGGGDVELCDLCTDSFEMQRAGLGQYVRGQHELVLLGVRGRCEYKTRDDGKRAQALSVIIAPRGRHSEKPDEVYAGAELVSHGPRLEMFARSLRTGWDSWGVDTDDHLQLGEIPL